MVEPLATMAEPLATMAETLQLLKHSNGCNTETLKHYKLWLKQHRKTAEILQQLKHFHEILQHIVQHN